MKKRNLLKNVTEKKTRAKKVFMATLAFLIFACGTYTTSYGYSEIKSPISDKEVMHFYRGIELKANSDSLNSSVQLTDTSSSDLIRDSLRRALVKEVESYIRKSNKNYKFDVPQLVDLCLEKEFDIPLLLSQAQLETNFGSTGIGRTKNSMFGFVSKCYKSKDLSIEDYVKTMQKSYLPEGRSVSQLFSSGFRNVSGYKYAGNPHYASEIKSIRLNILRTTNIDLISKQINNLK